MHSALTRGCWALRLIVLVLAFAVSGILAPLQVVALPIEAEGRDTPAPSLRSEGLGWTAALDSASSRLEWDRTLSIAAATDGGKERSPDAKDAGSKERPTSYTAKEATRATLQFTSSILFVVAGIGLVYCVVADIVYDGAKENRDHVEADLDASREDKRAARDEVKRAEDDLVLGVVVTLVTFGIAVVFNSIADDLDDSSKGKDKAKDDALSIRVLPSFSSSRPNTVQATYRW